MGYGDEDDLDGWMSLCPLLSSPATGPTPLTPLDLNRRASSRRGRSSGSAPKPGGTTLGISVVDYK
jgi:hypothetical protein